MEPASETFNPWTVVNVVFHHLAAQGLHPTLGGADPGTPAAELLRALGIEPAAEGDRQVGENVKRHLAEIRAAIFEDDSVSKATQGETPGAANLRSDLAEGRSHR